MDAKTLRASLILRAMEGKLVPRGHERGVDLLNEILSSEEIRCRPKNISKGILPTANFEDMLTVPDGWGMCRLGQISSVFEYGTSTKCHEEPADGDVIVLRMPNIQDGDVVFDKLKYANRNAVDSLFCKTGDLLFNRTNSMELVGKCATVKFKQDNVSFASYLIRVHLVGMDPEFVSFFINSLDCRYKQILPNTTQQNGQANFSGGKLKNVIIPVPSLDEQRRIVDRLNELLPLVDKFGKAQEAMNVAQKEFPEKLKASLLQEAIQGRLVPQLDDEPAVEQIGEAPEEVPFEIPEKWKWLTVGDACTQVSTGPFGSVIHKTDYADDGVPIVNPADMRNGCISTDKIKKVKRDLIGSLSSYVLKENDIVIARRGDLGRCAIVTHNDEGYLCGTGSFFLHLKALLATEYFITFFSSDYIKNKLTASSVGTTMANLNHKILKSLLVPVPPLSEQRRIVVRLNEILPLVDRMTAQATDDK